MASEKIFENKIKKWLTDLGAWYLKYWAGAKFTKEGIPDILACINGKFFGIEVKGPNGRPTLLQLFNLRKIREAGGFGILLYPKDWERFNSFIGGEDDLWYVDNIQLQSDWFERLNK